MKENPAAVFKRLQAHRLAARNANAASRIDKLRRLRQVIESHESDILRALAADLGKSNFEAAVTELYFVYAELDFAVKNLCDWVRPVRAGRSLTSPFAANRICYEPKGLCLILSPWNYPFQLTVGPLISAVAAGNCVMLKPSEISSATSAVISRLMEAAFDPREVACVEGDADVARSLLELPFDHIFFTGSTAVGKLVMEAAAKNMTSVTLELGGKSPVIIAPGTDLADAARRIAWGKIVNSGQTCIAPDHVFLHEDQEAEFIAHYANAIEAMIGDGRNGDYGRIVNRKHFDRLKALVDDALAKGAALPLRPRFDEAELRITPCLLTGVPPEAVVMEQEIFGPLLPLFTYTKLPDVTGQLMNREKPLALYIFARDRRDADYLVQHTSAGGTCINDVLTHISNPRLPFGGVNHSGMGSSHGRYGFIAFSHERAVMRRGRVDFTRLIYPPYGGKTWVLRLLKRLM